MEAPHSAADAHPVGEGAVSDRDNGWISDIVNGLLLIFQAAGNPAPMDEGNEGWLTFLFTFFITFNMQ
jgi:hypothetical protein